MRRRLDLAVTLILAPTVLFLDEPTTGLDPRNRNEVWSAIRALVAGGTTVLLTTQYLDEADQLADQVVVMDAGRVIAEGHARRAQGRRSAATGSTWSLEHGADLATAALDRRPGRRRGAGGRRRAAAGSAWPVAAAGGRRSPRSCARWPTPASRVADIGLRRPTLDDVFLRLTGHRAEPDDPGPTPDARRRAARRWRPDDRDDRDRPRRPHAARPPPSPPRPACAGPPATAGSSPSGTWPSGCASPR